MGIGFILIIEKSKADNVVQFLNQCGESAIIIGEIKNGERGVTLDF
jgi:phosphoribosylaminoimidazole (AIR) synthetase